MMPSRQDNQPVGDANYDGFALGDVTMTITDNDPASVAFTNAFSNVQEDGGTHTITVTLNIPGGGTLLTPITVDIDDDLSGTAEPSDYDLDTNSVTFGIGSADGTSRDVNFTINDDPDEEGNETIDISSTITQS